MTAMNKNIVVASVALLLDEEEQARKKRRTRTIWTRLWMLLRKIDGAFYTILKELKEQDSQVMLECKLIILKDRFIF